MPIGFLLSLRLTNRSGKSFKWTTDDGLWSMVNCLWSDKIYLHDNSNFTASGKGSSQYARNPQRLNPDQTRMPIPPKKNRADTIASELIGKRYTLALRFHSSLDLCFSAAVSRAPNRCADAISAIAPAVTNITPTSWIK